MKRALTIREALHETFHRSKKRPQDIADEMGVSYNYLARAVLEGPSGCNFPIRFLVPLMKTTGNYSALKVLARQCGMLILRTPRGGRELQIHEYQIRFGQLTSLLLEFFANPKSETYHRLIEALTEHMEDTAQWKHRVENHSDQIEIEFREW